MFDHPHFVWLPAPFLTAFERLVRKSAGRPCPNVTPSVFALSTPHYHTTRTTTATAKRTTTSRATWQPMFSHPGLSHLAHYPKQPPPPLLSHSCSHVTWDLWQLHFPFVNPPTPTHPILLQSLNFIAYFLIHCSFLLAPLPRIRPTGADVLEGNLIECIQSDPLHHSGHDWIGLAGLCKWYLDTKLWQTNQEIHLINALSSCVWRMSDPSHGH